MMAGFLTPQGDGEDCCCSGVSPESCTCWLFRYNCVLYWLCFGIQLCGVRLKHNGTIISEDASGDIYNPPAGVYLLEKCCNSGDGPIWVAVRSITVLESEGTSCLPCDCDTLRIRGVNSISIEAPDAFSIFDGTYAFSSPGECISTETFSFTAPPTHSAADTALWTGSCDSSGFDAWAAANDIYVDTYTIVIPGVGSFDYRHYYWPFSVEIGGQVSGLANYPLGEPGKLTAGGIYLVKNDLGVCSGPVIGGFASYFTGMPGIPAYPYCTLRWSRPYALHVSAGLSQNPRVAGCHLNLAKLASLIQS